MNERRNTTVAAFETVNLRRDNKSNSSCLRKFKCLWYNAVVENYEITAVANKLFGYMRNMNYNYEKCLKKITQDVRLVATIGLRGIHDDI